MLCLNVFKKVDFFEDLSCLFYNKGPYDKAFKP